MTGDELRQEDFVGGEDPMQLHVNGFLQCSLFHLITSTFSSARSPAMPIATTPATMVSSVFFVRMVSRRAAARCLLAVFFFCTFACSACSLSCSNSSK